MEVTINKYSKEPEAVTSSKKTVSALEAANKRTKKFRFTIYYIGL